MVHKKKPLAAMLAIPGLMAVMAGAPAMASSEQASAEWVDDVIDLMIRKEGVPRADLARFSETLMQSFNDRDPGSYFDSHPPSEVAKLAGAYGQSGLADVLADWDLDEKASRPKSASAPRPGAQSGSSRQQAASHRGGGSPRAGTAASNRHPDDEFIARTLAQMDKRATLSRQDADRFETIMKKGGGQEAISRYGHERIAGLAITYGMDDLGSTLKSQQAMAEGDNSAAARLGSVTSVNRNPNDYREDYLAEVNSHNVKDVARYSGATMTTYADDLTPFELVDPIAGREMEVNVTSCLYLSSTPTNEIPHATFTMQRMELPREVEIERFVERTFEGEVITEDYRLTRVALDWADATDTRVKAYFYGYKVPEPPMQMENGVYLQREKPDPPAWHSFSCSPRNIRSAS